MAAEQKKMNLVQLTFIVAVNMMGSGIIMLPTNMAQVGAISLLSWIVTAVGSMAIAYGFAQAGLFNQRAGGMAAYAEDAYGKAGYFLVFFLYFLSLAIGNVAIAISAVGYLAGVLPWLSATPIATCIGVIALLWLTTVANFGGPSVTGKIGSVTVWGVILPVGLLSIIGWFWFSSETFAAAWNPQGLSLGAGHGLEHLAHAVGLPRHGVGGAELRRGGEPEARRAARLPVRHARRRGHLHPVDDRDPGHRAERRALAKSTGPFGLAYAQDVQPDGRLDHHGAGGAGLPGLAARLAVHDRPDRQVGGGRADVPGVLLQGERMGAPVTGMIVLGVVQTLLALSTISPTLSEQFGALVNLAVVTNVIPVHHRAVGADGDDEGKPVVAGSTRATIVIALVAMLYSVYALYASGKDAVMGGMLVLAIAFIIWGFIAPRFAPRRGRPPRQRREQLARRTRMTCMRTSPRRVRAGLASRGHRALERLMAAAAAVASAADDWIDPIEPGDQAGLSDRRAPRSRSETGRVTRRDTRSRCARGIVADQGKLDASASPRWSGLPEAGDGGERLQRA